MSQPTPPPTGDDDRVSFTMRRTHAYALGGVLAGLLMGYLASEIVRGGGLRATPPGSAAVPVAAAAPMPAGPAPGALVQVSTEGRPFRGPANAPVTVVEFTDYQCPFCRRHFDSTLTPLLAQYGDRVRYVVRNFPIPSLHPMAVSAAQAAECANDQGKFWEYHDRLFQTEIASTETLKSMARQLGLNTSRFNRCLDSGEKADIVEQDVRDGVAAGVAGTPSFFVNGRFIDGWVPVSTFGAVVEQALGN